MKPPRRRRRPKKSTAVTRRNHDIEKKRFRTDPPLIRRRKRQEKEKRRRERRSWKRRRRRRHWWPHRDPGSRARVKIDWDCFRCHPCAWCLCFALLCFCLEVLLVVYIALTEFFGAENAYHLGPSVARIFEPSPVDNLYECPPQLIHDLAWSNPNDSTWVDFFAARAINQDTDCEELLQSYIDSFPLYRSCAQKHHLGLPDYIWDLMSLRRWIWSAVTDDLIEMCNFRKERLRRIDRIQEDYRTRDEPPGIFLSSWGPGSSFHVDRAFEDCHAQCEFVDDPQNASIVVVFDYCDYRTNTLEELLVGKGERQILAFIGWETIFPSFVDDNTRSLARGCWERLDVYASYNRFADLPVHFADLDTLLRIRTDDGPWDLHVYEDEDREDSEDEVNSFSQFKRDQVKDILSKFGLVPSRERAPDHFEVTQSQFLYPRLPVADEYRMELISLVQSRHSQGAMMLMSNCVPNEWSYRVAYRSEYVRILRRYLNIRIFGQCGSGVVDTSDFEDSIPNVEHRVAPCQHMKQYSFFLAFENGFREGYVTEKLWNAMLCPYTVPVYMGAPDVRRYFLPSQWQKYKFFVNANEFPDPRDLALYLDYLVSNTTAYLEYFQWMLDGVSPANVMKPIHRVFKNDEDENISFPCRLCELVSGAKSTSRFDYGSFLGFGMTGDVDQQP